MEIVDKTFCYHLYQFHFPVSYPEFSVKPANISCYIGAELLRRI